MQRRFEEDGGRLLVETLRRQKIVLGETALASELAKPGALHDLAAGDVLIEQDKEDYDVFFILAGRFRITVNGRPVAIRGPGEHIGEMAAINPAQKRSATAKAMEAAVVLQIPELRLTALAN